MTLLLLLFPETGNAALPKPGARTCGRIEAFTPSDALTLDTLAGPFLAADALLAGPLRVPEVERTEPLTLLVTRKAGGLADLDHPYARPGRSGAVTPGPTRAFALLVLAGERPEGIEQAREAAAEWARLILDRAFGPLPSWLESGVGSVVANAASEGGQAFLPPPPFSSLVASGLGLVAVSSLDISPWEPQREPRRWFTAWVLADWLIRNREGQEILSRWLTSGSERPSFLSLLASEMPDLDIRLTESLVNPPPRLDLAPPPTCAPSPGVTEPAVAAREALASLSMHKQRADGRLRASDRSRVLAAGTARNATPKARRTLGWLHLSLGDWDLAAKNFETLAKEGDGEASWGMALALRRGDPWTVVKEDAARARETMEWLMKATIALPASRKPFQNYAEFCNETNEMMDSTCPSAPPFTPDARWMPKGVPPAGQ